jgi:hypothetical protein
MLKNPLLRSGHPNLQRLSALTRDDNYSEADIALLELFEHNL